MPRQSRVDILGGYGSKGCTFLGGHAAPGNDLVFSRVS
jgi:hypothetical protein